MSWWGWLILGALGGAAALALVWYLSTRGRGSTLDANALLESERDRLAEVALTSSKARVRAEATALKLAEELERVASRHKQALEEVDDAAREKLERLLEDPDDLLRALRDTLDGLSKG